MQKLWRRLGLLVLVPHPFAVGNASEEVYYGLLAARRLNRRLLVLVPYDLPSRLRLPLLDYAVINVRSPLLFCDVFSPWLVPLRGAVTLYFGFFRYLSDVRVSRFGKAPLDDRLTLPMWSPRELWSIPGQSAEFAWPVVGELKWDEQYQEPLRVNVAESAEQACSTLLRDLGVPIGAWYACLHVRDGGFWRDGEALGYRNADIQSYCGLISAIVEAGGWVIRMGDSTMPRLPEQARVIDYAHSPLKSAGLDAYLVRHCEFYVGTQSGLLDVALLFERPRLITNAYTPFDLPCLPMDAQSFQTLRDVATGEKVDPLDFIDSDRVNRMDIHTFRVQGVTYEAQSAEYLERDMRAYLAWRQTGFARLENAESQANFAARYRSLLERVTFDVEESAEVRIKYRLASRLTRWLPEFLWPNP
jgi:putative glycosyltransferase (TIGR04372 family)